MTDTRTFTDPLAPAAAGAGWAWILAYGVLSLALGVLARLHGAAEATFRRLPAVAWALDGPGASVRDT